MVGKTTRKIHVEIGRNWTPTSSNKVPRPAERGRQTRLCLERSGSSSGAETGEVGAHVSGAFGRITKGATSFETARDAGRESTWVWIAAETLPVDLQQRMHEHSDGIQARCGRRKSQVDKSVSERVEVR